MLRRRGHRVVSVISHSGSSARSVARILGARIASTSVRRIAPETTLLLIAVPDDQIGSVAAEIAGVATLPWRALAAFHCSGIETSDALAPLTAKGVSAFALHPVQSFPAKTSLRKQLSLMDGVFYGFQGPRRSIPIGRRIVRELRGRMLTIPKHKKILYHAACVFASNYPVVLLDIVEDLAKSVSPSIGLEAFRPLTESSIDHAMTLSPTAALTGPVARASRRSVEQHRRELKKYSPAVDEVYRTLALAALGMAEHQGRATKQNLRRLRNLLQRRS